MKYISTSGKHTTDLKGVISNCFAPDGSLYLPERLPVIPRALFNNIEEMTLRDIAYVVVTTLLGGDVTPVALKHVVDDTFIYNVPFVSLSDGTDVMELFGGPTMAFKDFSAQFVANFIKQGAPGGLPSVAIVATTGNTGAAVANAFARHSGRHVVVLYPHGALNRSQLMQFTTLGSSVHSLEVGGDIGRCKQMVRQAMADAELGESMRLICVNTANYLRLVPQVVLFFYAYARLKKMYGRADGFSPAIPCGNLSMLASAVIASRIGLPMGPIVAGCNANDDLVRVLSGELSPEKVNVSSRPTLAKAMDSGFPTNLARVLTLYDDDVAAAAAHIKAYAVSDAEISAIIREEADAGYMVDPHTAVAIGALRKASGTQPGRPVVFATAHPAKSLDIITDITGKAIDMPLQLTKFMTRGVAPIKLAPSYPALRKFLLSEIIS